MRTLDVRQEEQQWLSSKSSAVEGDAVVDFYYKRGDYPEYLVGWRDLTVHTAEIKAVSGPTDVGFFLGFETTYEFTVRDKLGLLGPLPAPLPVNESFGAGGSVYPNENWGRASPNGMMTFEHNGEQVFRDKYRASGLDWPLPNPSTVNPLYPGWTTEVYWREQEYRAGSQTPGDGLLLRAGHTLMMKRGCGRQ